MLDAAMQGDGMIAPQSVLKPLAARKPNSQPKKYNQRITPINTTRSADLVM
jgi:hypothetical protein